MTDLIEIAANRRMRLKSEIEKLQGEIDQLESFMRYGRKLIDEKKSAPGDASISPMPIKAATTPGPASQRAAAS